MMKSIFNLKSNKYSPLKIVAIIALFLVFAFWEFLPDPNGVSKAPDGTCNCELASFDFCVRVTRLSDGDSFRGITEDNEELRFRIYGIDAPENKQAFSQRSKEYLSSLIYGKKVGVNVQTKDRWGRYVVYVFTPDCLDVSAEMLRVGMAWHFKRYDNTRHYSNLEKEARANRVGLWKDPAPVAPWEFRRN